MPTYAVIACAEHTKLELDLEQLLRRLSMAFDIPKHTTLIRPDSEASPEHRALQQSGWLTDVVRSILLPASSLARKTRVIADRSNHGQKLE